MRHQISEEHPQGADDFYTAVTRSCVRYEKFCRVQTEGNPQSSAFTQSLGLSFVTLRTSFYFYGSVTVNQPLSDKKSFGVFFRGYEIKHIKFYINCIQIKFYYGCGKVWVGTDWTQKLTFKRVKWSHRRWKRKAAVPLMSTWGCL